MPLPSGEFSDSKFNPACLPPQTLQGEEVGPLQEAQAKGGQFSEKRSRQGRLPSCANFSTLPAQLRSLCLHEAFPDCAVLTLCPGWMTLSGYQGSPALSETCSSQRAAAPTPLAALPDAWEQRRALRGKGKTLEGTGFFFSNVYGCYRMFNIEI